MASAGNVFWGQVASLFVAGAILVAFGASVGWLRDALGPQPIGGRWWMWLAPLVVLGFNAPRYLATDYGVLDPMFVVALLLLGVGVRFSEELLCRGHVVSMLRAGGHNERRVAALSSLIFALLHVGNLGAGQSLLAVGIDEVTGRAATGALAGIAGLANFVMIPSALVLLILVRGQVERRTYGRRWSRPPDIGCHQMARRSSPGRRSGPVPSWCSRASRSPAGSAPSVVSWEAMDG